MTGKPAAERRTGLLNGFAAYGMWGLVPLFWPLLKPAGAVEILAHRMVWSLVFVVAALAVVRRWAWIGELVRQPRKLALITVAAAVITVNWGVYIWSVNSGHVVEASLGYFINPLVTIAMGVLLLKERLRPAQWAAVGVGALAVVVLTVGYGRPPWISLCLAFSFAIYGLVKKKVNLGGIESLAAETAIQFLPALGYLVWLGAQGESTFGAEADQGERGDDAGRRGDPGAAVHAGAAAVPGTGLPVPARHPLLQGGHAARALGRVRPGVAGAHPAHLGRAAHRPPCRPRTVRPSRRCGRHRRHAGRRRGRAGRRAGERDRGGGGGSREGAGDQAVARGGTALSVPSPITGA